MATSWADLKVTELKAELKKRGQPVSGVKAELVARLEADDVESASASVEQVEQEPEKDEISSDVRLDKMDENMTNNLNEEAEKDNSAIVQTAESVLDVAVATDVDQKPAVEAPVVVDVLLADNPTDTILDTQVVHDDALAEPSLQQAPLAGASEIVNDLQKRKRRSSSPPPSAVDTPRKRVRADEDLPYTNVDGDQNMETMQASNAAAPPPPNQPVSPGQTKDARFKGLFDSASEHGLAKDLTKDFTSEQEPERTVEPAIHPATSALYIRDFQRPLNEATLKSHLIELAAAPGTSPDPKTILNFFLDSIRTHSFVNFINIAAASRVRAELHGRVWPNESNRTTLWADFIPPERVQEWQDQEIAGGRSLKWEVAFEPGEDGVISATLQEANSVPAARRPSSMAPPRPVAPPTGPRRQDPVPFGGAPPSGSRSMNIEIRGRGPAAGGARPSSYDTFPKGGTLRLPELSLDSRVRSTEATPTLLWQTASKDLANKRLDNFNRATSKRPYDKNGDLNRYSFDQGDRLIDRGEERFPGIRPPPRGERLGAFRGGRGENRGQFRDDRRGGGYRGGGGGGDRFRGGRGDRGGGGDRYDGSRRLSRDNDFDRRGGRDETYGRGSGRDYDRSHVREDGPGYGRNGYRDRH